MSAVITPIMFVAWLAYISLAVNIPYFIEEINRVSFDTILQREVSEQLKQKPGHNTFFGTVGFAVEAVEGTRGTPSSAVSVAIWRGRFLGRCFFFPFAFDDRFLPAGIVFDGSESASCKKILGSHTPLKGLELPLCLISEPHHSRRPHPMTYYPH